MSKLNEEKSALAELAKIPQVLSDFRLGLSHDHALGIAIDILNELSKKERDELFGGISTILYDWKDAHGKPAKKFTGLLGLMGADHERDEELSESERKLKIEELEPWECHETAKTPIALFNSLFASEYEPLNDFLEDKHHRFQHIEAILILLSHNKKSNIQSSDCIYAAISLARRQLKFNRRFVDQATPKIKAEFNRKNKQKAALEAKSERSKQRVRAAYERCVELGKPFNLDTIVFECDELFGSAEIKSKKNQNSKNPKHVISKSQVHRYMKQLGLSTKELHN